MSDLNQTQAAILAFLFDKLPIGLEVETLNFCLAGNFSGKFHSAVGTIDGSEQDGEIVFSVPSYTNDVFLALTHKNKHQVARVLANVEDYERENHCELDHSDVVLVRAIVGEADLERYGVLLIRTATSPELIAVPDTMNIAGREVRFFLAVPLTRDEYIYREQFGHDALMDMFSEKSKSLYFF